MTSGNKAISTGAAANVFFLNKIYYNSNRRQHHKLTG